MIVYRELSSLQKDLDLSLNFLFSVSNSIERRYHKKILQKENGEPRVLYVPTKELKRIQRRIADVLLSGMEISPYATAYRVGCGPTANALVHVGQPVLLKLDIRHFFDSILYAAVKEYAFPERIYSEQNRVLLSLLCTYEGVLPQGAPTSPAISNLILKGFDDSVGSRCEEKGIRYTRYCDDMTFSGDFDPEQIISLVRNELRPYGFFLNENKTKIVRNGQKKTVTGFVVNEKLNVSSDYRRKIRQEMHYCMKYGIVSHLAHTVSDIAPRQYAASLLGRVNFVLTANARDPEFLGYRDWLNAAAKELPQAVSPADKTPGERPVTNGSIVSVPHFGKVDISSCPLRFDPDGTDNVLYPDMQSLYRFVTNNFTTFRRSGRNYAVCRGENSLAAAVLIVEGILRPTFFLSAKQLLCNPSAFWQTIAEKTRGSDVRNGFPPFYTVILDLFKQLGLLYTNVTAGGTGPAAIVIPDYDKLIDGWLPRSRKKDILQRGIGLLAGEKNGIVLECLYGARISTESRSLGKVSDYKNGTFTLLLRTGRKVDFPVERFEVCYAKADWDPNLDSYFENLVYTIESIEKQVEYGRIGIGKENTGLIMRNNGHSCLFYKME